ncbi:MAG TPA: HAMP domain-containing sensor histidine kinase [Candidatus Thermoplasmatota archaeon]|nr:HAMP domain-containing sensor histidine kinase [Candidatus Thermoplasmatota archaeon]
MATPPTSRDALESDPRLPPTALSSRLVSLAPRLAAWVTLGTAAAVLIGWTLDNDVLKRVLPGFVAMNPATAVAFLCAGGALLLAARQRLRAASLTLAALACAIGLVKLAGLLLGWAPGVDELLFPEAVERTLGTGGPNRMAPNTALALTALGANLALLYRPDRTRWLRAALALVTMLLALLALLGYLYAVAEFSGLARFVPMALHTATLFLVLALGALSVAPTDPFPSLVLSARSGGTLARRFLPAALLLPIAAGYVRLLGQKAGFYETEFGLSLFVVVIILCFTGLAWAYAVALNRADRERDIAERERQAAAERLAELERLKQVNQFKTNLLNTASHELNTPLTPLKLQVHLLRSPQTGPLTERQRRAVDVLDRNILRLSLLVQDVLDVARLQGGTLPLHRQPVDFNRIVLEAVESFQEQADQKGIKLETRAEGERVLDLDGQRITQVVFNLLSNALKFTPPGGTILVETGRVGEEGVIRVRDTGMGLTPSQMSRLFQPFSQVHDTMQETRSGAGLGLYICKGIVEQHGGRITVASPGPGKGATFEVSLPGPPSGGP